ncbi:hypothetical protein GCM10010145_43190 [Streptomyces ruber]|uniref:SCP domain-containing protein n=2 Tax=Streptomyces TaxID=1883 RepID=A0A918BH73_9ACTN|nr:CAP domain-containing protein [Streptomyces ruber]GGQ68825.1 hypothetical protein GCM10010145_43190 [Streptomyces ruber]
MTLTRRLTAVLVGAAASAVTLTAAPASAATPAEMRAAVISLTNAERSRAGCPALQGSPALDTAAQRHAQDMADHDFFGHDGSDGSTMVSRAEAAGYTGWRALAENVAAGRPTAADVVRGWMDSPGHRANILDCSLKHIGVGYAYGAGTTYGHYWTQDFGTR